MNLEGTSWIDGWLAHSSLFAEVAAFLCATLKNSRGVICKMTVFWWKEKGEVEYINQKESRPIIGAFWGCWGSFPKEPRAWQPAVSLLAMVQPCGGWWHKLVTIAVVISLLCSGERTQAQRAVRALVVQYHVAVSTVNTVLLLTYHGSVWRQVGNTILTEV